MEVATICRPFKKTSPPGIEPRIPGLIPYEILDTLWEYIYLQTDQCSVNLNLDDQTDCHMLFPPAWQVKSI